MALKMSNCWFKTGQFFFICVFLKEEGFKISYKSSEGGSRLVQ